MILFLTKSQAINSLAVTFLLFNQRRESKTAWNSQLLALVNNKIATTIRG